MKQYLKDTSGNIALLFGLTCTVLVMGVGTAIDYGGLSSRAKTLQDYSDAAVLAAATSPTKELADLQTIVDQTLDMHNTGEWTIEATVTIDEDDVITVDTSTIYNTILMSIFGHDEMPINASSSSPYGSAAPLNIAFVLDSTFSMKDGNLDDLQVAAGNLIDDLEGMDNEKIRMSVVPFSEYVNVGVANRNEPWINVAPDDEGRGPEVCNTIIPSSTTCTGSTTNTGTRDGISYTYTTPTGCTTSPTGETPYNTCHEPVISQTTWRGCAGSRLDPDNIEPSVSGIGNRIPGLSYISPAPAGHFNPSCGTELLPLTTSYVDAKSRINGMSPNGLTYIPTGLMWGWRTLTAEAPFAAGSAPASDPDEPTINALILMSDGANTVRKEGEYHIEDTDSDAVTGVGLEANALTAETCAAIKDDDIVVYTVAYNFPADPAGTKAILEACATSPTNFFDANNAAELNAAFEKIGQQIFSVRLSR